MTGLIAGAERPDDGTAAPDRTAPVEARTLRRVTTRSSVPSGEASSVRPMSASCTIYGPHHSARVDHRPRDSLSLSGIRNDEVALRRNAAGVKLLISGQDRF